MKKCISYMGKKVEIAFNKAKTEASLSIDKNTFTVKLCTEGKPEDNYISLWMCPDTYCMTETPEQMARHIVQYWHQYADQKDQ